MYISKGFIAQEQGLSFYNAKAIIDLTFTFVYDDTDETVFGFDGYVSSYLYIYDERRGQLLKSYSLSRSANVLILNASVADMTFDDPGTYFFELGYNRSGYEMPLRYGKLSII